MSDTETNDNEIESAIDTLAEAGRVIRKYKTQLTNEAMSMGKALKQNNDALSQKVRQYQREAELADARREAAEDRALTIATCLQRCIAFWRDAQENGVTLANHEFIMIGYIETTLGKKLEDLYDLD